MANPLRRRRNVQKLRCLDVFVSNFNWVIAVHRGTVLHRRNFMDTLTKQWLERSDYDLETAVSMLESGRYLYVAFMCQQTIEKVLKAYLTSQGKTPPFVHNLPRLAEEASLLASMSEDFQQLLANLNPYYIKARYGEYKDSLSEVCKKEQAEQYLSQTREISQWLKQKIK